MGERVASILAEIGIDSSKFTTGANGVKSGLGGMVGGFARLAGGIGIAVTALGTLYEFLKKSEQAAVESAKIDAKLDAVLRSTAGAAGLTSDELDAYAASVSKAAGLDDELVKNAEAVLLTFTKVKGQAFKETMQAAADMSAVLGSDLQGSIIQVGKAMNDFSGYTALKRAGVSFTKEQIDLINSYKETNDLISYQKLLLKELETEFGGAAQAMNDAGDGSENLKVSWGNLMESIGSAWIPGTKAFNDSLSEMMDNWATNNRYNQQGIDLIDKYGTRIQEIGDYLAETGGYMTDFNFEGYARGLEATTTRLTEMARAYYLAHPELKKYVDQHGVLRDVLDKVADSEEDVADSADNAADSIDGIATSLGVLSNIDTGFGSRISEALDKIKFKEAGGVGLQNIGEQILNSIDTGALGTELGGELATSIGIGLEAVKVMTGEESAYEAKRVIMDTLGMTWAEANTELNKWLSDPKSMTVDVNFRYHTFMNNSSNGVPTTPEGWEIYLNKDLNGNGIIGRASGGPIWANHPYLVGERGPEMIVPSGNGNVIPNKNLAGNVVNFYGDAYFDVKDKDLTADVLQQLRLTA